MIPGCIPCLVQMAVTTARATKADDKKVLESARAALKILSEGDFKNPAPYFSAPILQKVCAIIRNQDPFKDAKATSNRIGLRLADELARPYLAQAKDDRDRLLRSLRASIAGNISDYAVNPDLAGKEEDKIREAFNLEFSLLDFDRFYDRLSRSKQVLFLCDNAGEIAFDRVLIEEFLAAGKRVTAAVKAGPALNDALLEDAAQVGLDKIEGVELITTGQAMMGIDLSEAGPQLKSAWLKADLILAKGQANFESLAGLNGKIFFLTMIKCKALEAELGLKKGSAIFISGETFNEQFDLS